MSTTGGSPETRRDAAAALGARRELGPEFDDPIAAGLAERVEQLAAVRSAELAHQAELASRPSQDQISPTQRFVLGMVSLTAGIPITAVSASLLDPALPGVLIAWAGIVGVNLAAGRSTRRR